MLQFFLCMLPGPVHFAYSSMLSAVLCSAGGTPATKTDSYPDIILIIYMPFLKSQLNKICWNTAYFSFHKNFFIISHIPKPSVLCEIYSIHIWDDKNQHTLRTNGRKQINIFMPRMLALLCKFL